MAFTFKKRQQENYKTFQQKPKYQRFTYHTATLNHSQEYFFHSVYGM